MIISASRRTDIPSYYFEWFLHRIHDGYVYVRNPMRFHQVSVVSLSPDLIDGIVFWTKNPAPALPMLSSLQDYVYYFQFTLNPYGPPIETNLPPLASRIHTFQQLSSTLGPQHVVWRYDPILMGPQYTIDYHIHAFHQLAEQLHAYTDMCTISFLDMYRNIQKRMAAHQLRSPSHEEILILAEAFSHTAAKFGLQLNTCAEDIDLHSFHISHASCIDSQRLERLGQYSLSVKADVNQRTGCRCAASIDIGAYHSCKNGCIYCYANHNTALVQDSFCQHHVDSPLLYGTLSPQDTLIPRKMCSCKRPLQLQISE